MNHVQKKKNAVYVVIFILLITERYNKEVDLINIDTASLQI